MDKYLSQVRTQRKLYEMYLPLSKAEQRGVDSAFNVMEIYCSNHIEGNSYTKEETTELLDNNKPSRTKPFTDSIEVFNLNNALVYSKSFDGTMTIDFILNLHRILTSCILNIEDCGVFKTKPNKIDDIQASTPAHTPIHMRKLVEWFNSQVKDEDNIIKVATEFKYRFLVIHPFADGNGRMSRLLFNSIIARFGYVRCFITPERREAYYSALKDCNKTSKIDSLYRFMCESLVTSYIDVIQYLE